MIEEEAVLIVLKFPDSSTDKKNVFDALMKLEDLIREAVEIGGVGSVDGHEFMMADGKDDEITYFIYGRSADQIAATVKPLVIGLPYLPGSYIVKQTLKNKSEKEYLAVN